MSLSRLPLSAPCMTAFTGVSQVFSSSMPPIPVDELDGIRSSTNFGRWQRQVVSVNPTSYNGTHQSSTHPLHKTVHLASGKPYRTCEPLLSYLPAHLYCGEPCLARYTPEVLEPGCLCGLLVGNTGENCTQSVPKATCRCSSHEHYFSSPRCPEQSTTSAPLRLSHCARPGELHIISARRVWSWKRNRLADPATHGRNC